MLYYYLINLFVIDGSVRDVSFLAFRCAGALITSLIFTFILTNRLIKFFHENKHFQPIRKSGPATHIVKKSTTPTMGGLIMMLSIVLSALLWTNLSIQYIWISLFVMVSFGIIGLLDDIEKVLFKNTQGLRGSIKIIIQFVITIIALLWLQYVNSSYADGWLSLPFVKGGIIDLGVFYLSFAMIIVVGSANAVNITDGLDGLAIVPIMIAAGALGVLAAIVNSETLTKYIMLHHIEGVGEISVIATALIGSGLAFLWYNIHPAKIMMGDVGSLMLGSLLGFIAILVKHELFYAMIGCLFVVEAVSVILQVSSWLIFKKRIFLMAPLHHHFEKLGWSEEAVVIRFWIFSILCSIIAILAII